MLLSRPSPDAAASDERSLRRRRLPPRPARRPSAPPDRPPAASVAYSGYALWPLALLGRSRARLDGIGGYCLCGVWCGVCQSRKEGSVSAGGGAAVAAASSSHPNARRLPVCDGRGAAASHHLHAMQGTPMHRAGQVGRRGARAVANGNARTELRMAPARPRHLFLVFRSRQ